MNYVQLRRGDCLPAVGVLQKLLNRTGFRLVPDGNFGPRTESAVKEFQRLYRLRPDGIVGEKTWPRLAPKDLPIVDCIDVFDPSLDQMENKDISAAGGNPVVIGGMCNGVEEAVHQIVSVARKIFLLRFHGHGAPGVAGLGFGQGETGWGEHANIGNRNFNELEPVLTRLRPIFGPYGNIQFMHCSTGQGQNGRLLLHRIADALGVPVTGALQTQYGGGQYTFQYEGPTFTAVPEGATLEAWCQSIPDFPGLSLA